MRKTITSIILLSSFLLISMLSSCTSKEERCNQVAVAMLKYDFINSIDYHNKKWNNICLNYWSYDGNDTWRDCILDATSREVMNKCGVPTTLKPYQQ